MEFNDEIQIFKLHFKKYNELRDNKEQVLEVEFDFKIEKQFIETIPYLKDADNIHDTKWLLTFNTTKDMRPAVFDFAHDNGLKTLQLNAKNKNRKFI